MIEGHRYGKLRRFTNNQDPSRNYIAYFSVKEGDTIEKIVGVSASRLKKSAATSSSTGNFSL
jgi:hypothetical protein